MNLLKKNAIISLLIIVMLISGCSNVQESPSYNSAFNIDYENAEQFEDALNSGIKVKGKTVKFVVSKCVPDSALGFNCWAGEHLNFISDDQPDISSGDIVLGLIMDEPSKTPLLGSWKIYYKILEIIPLAETESTEVPTEDLGMIAISQPSSYYVGKPYMDVVSQLEQGGFSNIITRATYDLYFSTSKKEMVDSVVIGDISSFEKGDSFNPDVGVFVIYHMYYKDNPDLRTYHGVVYDRAFSCSGHDGLRARFKCAYLFNESEHTVIYIMYTSAGGSKTRSKSGTYAGLLDDGITITWDSSEWESSDATTTFEPVHKDDEKYWYDGVRNYSETDVESAINGIKS